MKNVILIVIDLATIGLAHCAFGQGEVNLNNALANEGVVQYGTTGSSVSGYDWYSGPAGIQVWYLNGTNYDLSRIDGLAANPSAAYTRLTADGFTLATSFTGTNLSLGQFQLGGLQMPGVTGYVGGSETTTITMAIAAWRGAGSSYGSDVSGVLAFYQLVSDYTRIPPNAPPDLTGSPAGFNTMDLILAPIQPHLTIIPFGAKVILTWPTNDAGFTLQSTTNPVSPAAWTTNLPSPIVVNGQNTVTNAVSAAQQFYRLSL